ncbi:hypothetical protein [Pantoea phage LIMElight]|uniref:Uncharacterized protein n=1 Tax=Pantoea phage LIMElight TaxID=881915 RepID=E1Y3X1_9CAUD|nr:hypothetical protein F370_gp22 [Pantoea phage LIMElight]CBW54780.1 hypothetical protein [Pantoea phage LIMElight]
MILVNDAQITGTLVVRNGSFISAGGRLEGHLFGDTATHGNHPFVDGTRVNTSTVESVIVRDGGVFVKTRNSIYRIKTVGDITQ